MVKDAGGSGAANDATVVAVDGDPEEEARLEEGRKQGAAVARQVAKDDLAAAEAKVEHQKAELAAAEQAADEAKAALAALDKE